MTQEQFKCPGDHHPIAPSVHFARLRAGFSHCKDCSSNHEQGLLEFLQRPKGFNPVISTHTEEISFNSTATERLIRSDQSEYFEAIVHHIADWFWSQQAFVPTKQDFLSGLTVSKPSSPTLVVGFDGDLRTSERMTWAIERLNLLGVKIIDTGKTPLSCLEYLKINLEADGYLTLNQIQAMQHTFMLECLSKHGKSPFESTKASLINKSDLTRHRPQRTSGSWRTHSGLPTYEASLLRRLHGLRPLKICLFISNPYHQVLIQQLSEEWPCKSLLLPQQEQPLNSIHQQMAAQIRKTQADLGCQISQDGKHAFIWDQSGHQLTMLELTSILTDFLIQEYPADFISVHCKYQDLIHRLGIYQDRIKQHQHQSDVFTDPACRLLVNHQGEIWHKDPELRRDGFLTLIYIIKKLSEKDINLSELVRLEVMHKY